jgi:hypothetical protein
MGVQRHAPDILPSGKARGWLNLGASLKGYGISPPAFEPQTIHSPVRRFNDYAFLAYR